MRMKQMLAKSDNGLRGYALAAMLVAISTVAGLVVAPRWGSSAVDLIFLPAVLATAIFAGRGPAIMAAIASALSYNYFFTAPYHTFIIHNPEDVVTVIILFLVAMVTSQLVASVRTQAQLAEAHAARNATIAGLARALLSSTSEQGIAEIGARTLARLFDCNVVVLVPRPELEMIVAEPPGLVLTPSDLAVAALVVASGEPAGRGIDRAVPIEWQFHPVRTISLTVAVVGLARDDGAPAATAEWLSLLGNLLDQIALALERSRLEVEARDFVSLRERDHTRSTLLSSIGKDLEPPLSAIGSAVDSLRRSGKGDKETLAAIGAETARLQRYLANLLDLTPEADQRPIEVGGVAIDLFRRSVSRNGEDVHLTPKEYAILAELAKHPGRVLTHAHLLRTAWGPAQEKQTEYLRVAVRSLRHKLEANPARPRLILNEPAIGYRLKL